jgi:hypothetical protein
MKEKSLLKTNSYLKPSTKNDQFLVRNIASSTAIETRESVAKISAKMIKLQTSKPAVLQKKPA